MYHGVMMTIGNREFGDNFPLVTHNVGNDAKWTADVTAMKSKD